MIQTSRRDDGMSDLERVVARDEIRQLAYRYAYAIDARDLDLLVSLFVPDVRVTREASGRAAMKEFFTASLRAIGVSILFVGNHIVDFESATRAKGVVYCRGQIQDGERVVLHDVDVQRVARRGDGFEVNGEAFDLVVNTVPLPQIEAAIEEIPAAIRKDIQDLVPISLVNVMIGVKLDEPLPDLSWIYLPFPEQGPTNRATYYSNYSKFNAPEGHGCFLAEVTHRGDLRADDPQLLQDVVHGLDRAGVLRKEQVMLLEACDNEFAYIDQDLAFRDRVGRGPECHATLPSSAATATLACSASSNG